MNRKAITVLLFALTLAVSVASASVSAENYYDASAFVVLMVGGLICAALADYYEKLPLPSALQVYDQNRAYRKQAPPPYPRQKRVQIQGRRLVLID